MGALLKLKPNTVGGLIGALLAVATGYSSLYWNLPWSKVLLHSSYDLPFVFRPTEPPAEVAMVYLNDEAHQALGQPFTAAWDRDIHARLVERLTADGARAVVFDVVFSDAATNDARFAQAIRENGRVILAADYTRAGVDLADGMKVTAPTPVLRAAAAGWGIAQVDSRPDYLVRRHYHGPMDMEPPTSSHSWAAAKLCGAKTAQDLEARVQERWVNYYGPPGTLAGRGIHQVVLPDGTPPGWFSNKVVFVGAYLNTFFSGERKDELRHPYTSTIKGDSGRSAWMSGAEVHATIFLNLLRRDWLTRSTAGAELLGLLLFGLGFGYGLVQVRPLVSIGVGVPTMALVSVAAYLTFARLGFWFPWLIFVAQIGVALAWAIGFNSIQLYVQKKMLEQTLAFYLSPKLVRKFAGDREVMKKFLQPGAEKQVITILFSDIASFTSISEGMDSDDLAHSMNQYFEQAVAHCIHETDGTVVKYIGDAIFAFWNAPDHQADHQWRACRAALHFRDQEPPRMNGHPLITRIGLHTGVANVGNFGSTQRVDYTALGENINLASRMEGLNKYLGTTVLMTGEAYHAIADQVVARFAGRFRLKGFEKSVEVFEPLAPADQAEATRVWRESFAEGLKAFQARNLEAAAAAFRRTMELHPDDGPSKFYVARIEEFRAEGFPEHWQGEVELKEK